MGRCSSCPGRSGLVSRKPCQIAALKGEIFAYEFCRQFRCPPGAMCMPVHRRGICGCATVEGNCPQGSTAWECDHTVSEVTCACLPRAGLSPDEIHRRIMSQFEERMQRLPDEAKRCGVPVP